MYDLFKQLTFPGLCLNIVVLSITSCQYAACHKKYIKPENTTWFLDVDKTISKLDTKN